MRYIVDKGQTKREELPPEDGSEEGGWVDLKCLSAADVRKVDRMCQVAGITLGSVSGILLLLENAIVAWSLPLPTDKDHLRESLNQLSLDVVNFLGNAMLQEMPLTEEQKADLSLRRSGPTAQEMEGI